MSEPSYYNSPRNALPNLSGQYYRFAPLYIRGRNPTTADTRPKENQGYYPVGSLWVTSKNPPEIWILATIEPAGSGIVANWVLIANSTLTGPLLTLSDSSAIPGQGIVVSPSIDTANPPGNIQLQAGPGISIVSTPSPTTPFITISNTSAGTETLTGDDGVAVLPNGLGTIFTFGNVVNNQDHIKPVFTTSPAAFTERWDVQLSAAFALPNVNRVGLAAFSSAQFVVDGTGFVTLAGGLTPAVTGITPDAFTAPGTSPTLPNGSGNIRLEGGATFATGTQANPIRANSLAANTIDLQIQLAGANPAVSTPNDFGVSQFDSNSFTVASGFVQLANGGTTGAVTNILGDDGGANQVVPTAGRITLDGVVVTNAIGAANGKPVFFKKNAVSIEELDVQLATISTFAARSINKSGLAHFDSVAFTVDPATGFIALAGTASLPAVQTLTGNTGAAVGPSPTGNIDIKGGATILVAGTPGTFTLKPEVIAPLNTFLLGTGATTEAVSFGPLTTGQLIIGSTGVAPVAATLTAGTGISIANNPGSITINSTVSEVVWIDIAASQSLVVDTGYICIAPGGALVLTLPLLSAQGSIIEVALDGSTSWTIAQNAGQQIRLGSSQTTAGVTGSLASTAQGDTIRMVCSVANIKWNVLSSMGNITVA